VGYVPKPDAQSNGPKDVNIFSFRSLPGGINLPPALSAPIGLRSILAEVRAPPPPRQLNPIVLPHQGSAARALLHEKRSAQEKEAQKPLESMPIPQVRQKETMSRGNLGGGKSARMDAFTWLSSVKVGDKKETSSGPGSRTDSGNGSRSRMSSKSRPPSGPEDHGASSFRRSGSKNRTLEKESDGGQSLQDEYGYLQRIDFV
jgi:WD repeat-containing protein 59